jgi:addiction module HigA family antidote
MTKIQNTPGAVLQSFIDKYQINPFLLSKEIKLNYKTVLDIIKGKAKITVPTALKLGKYFDNSPHYWLDLQLASEINKLSADKKFLSTIKNIQKVETPKTALRGKPAKRDKPARQKSNTLSEKRKKAAKVPGAKKTAGMRTRRKQK